ncbi:MAG: PQQ-dependent sugar dehydrogenase [Actinomycetota bacterium]|nr:PQQ-dependent sugar dehydrogenase [Actinomycetota bacterium]
MAEGARRRRSVAALAAVAALVAVPSCGVEIEGRSLPGYVRGNSGCDDAPPGPDIDEEPLAGYDVEPLVDASQPTTVLEVDGTMFIAEREGTVAVWSGAGAPETVIDVGDDTATNADQGLFGLAVSPEGDRLLVHRTRGDGSSVLTAHVLDGGEVAAEGAEILVIDQYSSQHNGGDVRFGPDGALWLTVGDGGGQGDPSGNAQDPSTRLGSFLRYDWTPATATSEPTLEPAGEPTWPDADPATRAIGVRNPFRWSFDDVTGDLWLADVGQACVEEIDRVDPTERGVNLGWPGFEGTRPYFGALPDGEVHHEPVFEYWHRDGRCAAIGGYVYRGDALAALRGRYLFGDLCSGEIIALDPDGDEVVALDATVPQLTAIVEGADGEPLLVSGEGAIGRLVAD